LKEAHDGGITHRDIKPANLLRDRSGVVKILDLGLARVSQGLGPTAAEGSESDLTVSGVIVGTVDYMSPEQAYDPRLADPRSDIYSLGCTLHYLLTGRSPFGGKTFMERMLGHRERPIPSLRNQREDVPVPLDELFCRMMAKSVAGRPQTMGELLAALQECRPGRSRRPSTRGRTSPAQRAPDEEDRFDPKSIYGLVDSSLDEPDRPGRPAATSNVYVRSRGSSGGLQGNPSSFRRRRRRRNFLKLLLVSAVAIGVWLIARRRGWIGR
jgi:serine/threonine protein kinase